MALAFCHDAFSLWCYYQVKNTSNLSPHLSSLLMLRLLLCFFCNHTECLHFEITRKILYRSALFALLPSSGKCLLYVEMSCFWRTFLFMSSKKENDCVKKLKSCCLMERTSHQGSWQWTVNWRAFLWSCTDFYVTETQLRPCEHFS